MHLNFIYTVKILRKHLLDTYAKIPQPPFLDCKWIPVFRDHQQSTHLLCYWVNPLHGNLGGLLEPGEDRLRMWLVREDLSGRGYGNSLLPAQFCCELKSALK